MAHKTRPNLVLAELDDIAMELERTGNPDLAGLVDEVSSDLSSARPRRASKKKASRKKPSRRSKKNRSNKSRTARSNKPSRRARIASAMRKIASSQVTELEDIAAELLKEGDKKSAVEVLKIAEDLDSEYCYSETGKHESPKSKGDASKIYDRSKANKPNAKMDKEEQDELDALYEEDFYPLDMKEASFDTRLAELLHLAMDDDSDMAEDEDVDAMDRQYGSDDADPDMPDMDEDEDEDSFDPDMDGDDDSEDSEDNPDEDEDDFLDADEDGDEDDLGLDFGDADEEEPDADEEEPDADEEEPDADEEEPDDMKAESDDFDLGDEEAADSDPKDPKDPEDMDDMDDMEDASPEDEEAGVMSALGGGAAGMALGGPLGALGGAALAASAKDSKKVMALARKIAARGDRKLARRVANLVKKSK